MAKANPQQRVREEERRLRRMELAHKNRALFDRGRQMRELLSARLQADQMGNYLGSLNSAYRVAADQRQRIEQLARQAFRDTHLAATGPGEALRYFPTSYANLRQAVDKK